MNIVFDLDNTLSDASHREHLVRNEPKQKDEFHRQSKYDFPIMHAFKLMYALAVVEDPLYHDGRLLNRIEIWSGRREGKEREIVHATMDWLRTHCPYRDLSFLVGGAHFFAFLTPVITVRLRADFYQANDLEYKRMLFLNAKAQGHRVDLAFEDRDRCVAMWREEGVPCYQVAPGDF